MADGELVELLEPREVPLGGPRAMTVRRTLPQKKRSLVGAWCFVDSYGPDPVSGRGAMDVPPHPHTDALQLHVDVASAIQRSDPDAAESAMLRITQRAINEMTFGWDAAPAVQS